MGGNKVFSTNQLCTSSDAQMSISITLKIVYQCDTQVSASKLKFVHSRIAAVHFWEHWTLTWKPIFLSVFLSRPVYVVNVVNCKSDPKLHIHTSNHEIGIVLQLSAIHSVIHNFGTTGSTHPCKWVPVHIFDVLNCFDVQMKSACESCTNCCWCSVFSMCGHI